MKPSIPGSVLLIAFGMGCASSGPSAGAPAPTGNSIQELEALFQREKEVPSAKEVRSPDELWTAQLPSATEVELIRGQGHTQAHFSLGTEAKTRCFFYHEPIDAGQAIATILSRMREKVEFEELYAYRVGAAQGTPVVFIEGRYLTATKAGNQLGALKLAVSPRHSIPVLCFLDEPGYKETFASAITELLSTLKTAAEGDKRPSYSEIWEASLDGVPLGFQWSYMLDRGQGKRTTISLSATFARVAKGELHISDELEALESDAKGVVKGTFFESTGGEIAHELELTRTEKSKYRVIGKLHGQDFKAEFKAPKLSDDITFYRFLMSSDAEETKLSTSEYSPSLDPARPSDVTYVLDRKARTVSVQVNGASLLATIHESGLPVEISAVTGDRRFKQKIIDRSGQP